MTFICTSLDCESDDIGWGTKAYLNGLSDQFRKRLTFVPKIDDVDKTSQGSVKWWNQ